MQSIKYAVAGVTTALATKQQYQALNVDMMSTIEVIIQTQGPAQYNLDNNGAENIAWSTNCVQNLSGTSKSCGLYPTLVTEAINDNNLAGGGASLTGF